MQKQKYKCFKQWKGKVIKTLTNEENVSGSSVWIKRELSAWQRGSWLAVLATGLKYLTLFAQFKYF